MAELHRIGFEQILSEADGKISELESKSEMINLYMDRVELSGHLSKAEYYKALQEIEKSTLKVLEEERKALVDSLDNALDSGAVEMYSEAWFDLRSQIENVDNAILDSKNTLLEFDKQMRQMEWDMFDFARGQESKLMDEADFLLELLGGESAYDEIGNLTSNGLSRVGLHATNYNAYLEQSIKYAEELAKLEKQIADTPADTELVEKYNERLELQQNMVLAAKDEKEAIIELVSEGIELQKGAVQDLVDTYLSAVEAEKELYEYQKKTSNQTKKIAQIQKQLAAYGSNDSEEARAKVQKLKVELEEEQEQLDSMKYEKYMDEQKNLMNTLVADYEQHLDNYLSDTATVITDAINSVNASNSIISSTIQTESEKVGYELSAEMRSIWTDENSSLFGAFDGVKSSIESGNGILAQFDVKLGETLGEMQSEMEQKMELAAESLNGIGSAANGLVENTGTLESNTGTMVGILSEISETVKNLGEKEEVGSDSDFFWDKASAYDKQKLDTNTSIVDRLKYYDFDSSFSARKHYYEQMGFKDNYIGSHTQNVDMLDWMKKNYKGYKHGSKHITHDQDAWTNEGYGQNELHYRASDGAIYTRLGEGDMIFTHEQTQKLWELTRGNLGVDYPMKQYRMPDVPTVVNGGNVYLDIGDVVLPNVREPEDFAVQLIDTLKHSTKAQKAVRAVSVDLLAGKPRLATF